MNLRQLLFASILSTVILYSCGKDDNTVTPKPVNIIEMDQDGVTYRFNYRNNPDAYGDNAYYANTKELRLHYSQNDRFDFTSIVIDIHGIDLDNPVFPQTFDTSIDSLNPPRLSWSKHDTVLYHSDLFPFGQEEILFIEITSFKDRRLIGTFEGKVYDGYGVQSTITNGKFDTAIDMK